MKGILYWIKSQITINKAIENEKKLVESLGIAAQIDYDKLASDYKKANLYDEQLSKILIHLMGKPTEIKDGHNDVTVYKWKPNSFAFFLKMADEIGRRIGNPTKFDSKAYMNDYVPTKYYSYDWNTKIPIISLTCLCSEIKNNVDRIDIILIIVTK